MRLPVTCAVLALGATVGAVVFLLPSCGGSDSKPATATQPPSADDSFTLTVTDATVVVPAGAFDAGVNLNLKNGDPPALFTSQPDLTPATNIVATLEAETATGAAVSEAKGAMTITLRAKTLANLTGAAADLCVFAVGPTEAGYVWRRAALQSVATDGTVVFASRRLGTFQLYYCGDATLSGFSEMLATGSPAET